MNIIRHKFIFFTFSCFLVVGSIFAVAVWGLRPAIDFTGGSLLEIEFRDRRPPVEEVRRALEPLGLGTLTLQPAGEKGLLLRFKSIDESVHGEIVHKLGEGILEKRFDSIGPTIGKELWRRAWIALALAIAAIVLYIAWAFRKVSEPVSSWKYGVVAVAALLHDVLIPTGVFAVLGHFHGVEVDALFVTALLTVMGFSVHDTIVVFDRIRENLRMLTRAEPFEGVVNRSINETVVRSINTSFTVLLVLGAIMVWGGSTSVYFALALILGITFGTYSSIFIASPLLVVWQQVGMRQKK